MVQAEAFRPIVRGRDAILRAETGSGKTLVAHSGTASFLRGLGFQHDCPEAYLLPLVNRIYHLHVSA